MVVRLVANSFVNGIRYIIPDPSPFYLKSDNSFHFGQFVTVLTGFYGRISRRNCAHGYDRIWSTCNEPVADALIPLVFNFPAIAL